MWSMLVSQLFFLTSSDQGGNAHAVFTEPGWSHAHRPHLADEVGLHIETILFDLGDGDTRHGCAFVPLPEFEIYIQGQALDAVHADQRNAQELIPQLGFEHFGVVWVMGVHEIDRLGIKLGDDIRRLQSGFDGPVFVGFEFYFQEGFVRIDVFTRAHFVAVTVAVVVAGVQGGNRACQNTLFDSG